MLKRKDQGRLSDRLQERVNFYMTKSFYLEVEKDLRSPVAGVKKQVKTARDRVRLGLNVQGFHLDKETPLRSPDAGGFRQALYVSSLQWFR